MAKATKTTERKVTDTHTITLTLSVDEATTLALVLANVGGERKDSPRKHAQEVLNVLSGQGVAYSASTAYKLVKGSMVFSNYPASFKGESLRISDPFSYNPYVSRPFGGLL